MTPLEPAASASVDLAAPLPVAVNGPTVRALGGPLELPIVSYADLDGSGRALREVQRLCTAPIGAFGAIVAVAGSVLALPWVVGGAVVVTGLTLAALRSDVQLQRGIELREQGDVRGARAVFSSLVTAAREPRPQRQRARAHLASLAWHAGEVEHAAAWVESYAAAATHEGAVIARRVQLSLALVYAAAGRLEPAAAALARVQGGAMAARDRRAWFTAQTWLAFAAALQGRDTGSLTESSLDSGWAAAAHELEAATDVDGPTLALGAWGLVERGELERGELWVERWAHHATQAAMAPAPALAQWVAQRPTFRCYRAS